MAEKSPTQPKTRPPKLKVDTEGPKPSVIKQTITYILGNVYQIISSTTGIVIIFVIYTFIGAFLFRVIEGGHEYHHKKEIAKVGWDILESMWNTSAAVKQNEAAFKLLLKRELKKYERKLLESYGEGISTPSDGRDWDFMGSLFYSATITTTIGYGHISPVTDGGRIATMLYSVIGIPLCLITMNDLGKVLTKALKYIWSLIRKAFYKARCFKARMLKPAPTEAELKQKAANHFRHPHNHVEQPDVPLDEPYVIDEEFNLPILVAVFVVVIYILLGAALYRLWEKWTYLEAFYFIFISISTIGFGDVLPEYPKYFLGSSIYILIGLSLVAMVINVIMEDMNARLEKAKTKMADVSRTIGLTSEVDELSSMNTGSPTSATPKS